MIGTGLRVEGLFTRTGHDVLYENSAKLSQATSLQATREAQQINLIKLITRFHRGGM
jgi:hypothetical protein